MHMCIHTWNYALRYNTPPKSNRLFNKTPVLLMRKPML